MQATGRLLNMGANPAAMNMAIDEAILLTQKAQPNPTLRFYEWSSPAFSFGYFQDIASEVDVEACGADNIELVKRMTGGGTVVHGWELTYTLVLPRDAAEMDISEAYQRIGQSLVKAFQKLGVPAQCYTAYPASSEAAPNICLTNPAEHDVMSDDKKLAGVSVRRNRDGILFQGYISLDMPPSFILNRVSKNSEVPQSVREKSTALNRDGRSITRDALIRAVYETLEIGIAFNAGKLSSMERTQAETLVETKYATAAWNFNINASGN